MRDRGLPGAHSPGNRWVITSSPQREDAFHRRKRPVGVSWRLDEPYLRVKGAWCSLERAVEKRGQPIDVLLTAHRDMEAALGCLKNALRRPGVPETMTMAGREPNAAARTRDNTEPGTHRVLRPGTSLPTMGEQDPGGVRRVTRPRFGVKSVDAAQGTLAGIERRPRLKTRQRVVEAGHEGLTAAEPFEALAASSLHPQGQLSSPRLHLNICDRAGSFPSTVR
jgi:putative transposase